MNLSEKSFEAFESWFRGYTICDRKEDVLRLVRDLIKKKDDDVFGLIQELENGAVRMKYEEDKHITYWVRLNDVYELFEVKV